MTSGLPVHAFPSELTLEQFSGLPWRELGKDWENDSVIDPPSYHLAVDPTYLWFGARRDAPPCCDRAIPSGMFFEGLWVYDAAELFLPVPGTEEYVELNFSPVGAWWCCAFTSHRERMKEQPPPPSCTISATLSDHAWEITACLALDTLPLGLGDHIRSGSFSLNVAFILIEPEKKYLTAQRLPGDKIDFHRLETLSAAQIVRQD